MGVERQGHEPVPRVIRPHLVLVEANLLFALLEALLDGPALSGGRHDGVPPNRAERKDEIVGPLARRRMPPDEQGVVASGLLLPREGKQGPVIPPSLARSIPIRSTTGKPCRRIAAGQTTETRMRTTPLLTAA